MSKEKLKDGGNWTPEMNARFDALTGPGGVPDDQARSIILNEAGLKVFPKKTPTRLPFSAIEVTGSDIVEATQRVVHDEPDVPQPAPPQPGETDEQIRQRHRDALKARAEALGTGPISGELSPDVQQFMTEKGWGDATDPHKNKTA